MNRMFATFRVLLRSRLCLWAVLLLSLGLSRCGDIGLPYTVLNPTDVFDEIPLIPRPNPACAAPPEMPLVLMAATAP